MDQGTESKKFKPLKVKSIDAAVTEAMAEVTEARSGKQRGLLCRWWKINNAVGGSWQFNNNYLLAGPSGSGKSYILNMLHRDFTNKDKNYRFKRDVKVLHFSFEMSASDEVIRSLSTLTKLSYTQILSSFEPLSDTDFENLKAKAVNLTGTEIYYVEIAGNRYQIYETVKAFKLRFPESELVVTLDHSLLTEYLDESDEIQLMAELARMFMRIRKEFRSLNILVGQLNDKIEDPGRIKSPMLHYPKKTDIHGSKQIYWAMDSVAIIHKPEMLGITSYGPKYWSTDKLIAWHQIKMRKATPCIVRLRDNLDEGKITLWDN